jgi:hypothetical protein
MNQINYKAIHDTFEEVVKEVESAKSKWPGDFKNTHEAYAVIKEEFDELWDEIRKKNPGREQLRHEAIQTTAMLFRLITELL